MAGWTKEQYDWFKSDFYRNLNMLLIQRGIVIESRACPIAQVVEGSETCYCVTYDKFYDFDTLVEFEPHIVDGKDYYELSVCQIYFSDKARQKFKRLGWDDYFHQFLTFKLDKKTADAKLAADLVSFATSEILEDRKKRTGSYSKK